MTRSLLINPTLNKQVYETSVFVYCTGRFVLNIGVYSEMIMNL